LNSPRERLIRVLHLEDNQFAAQLIGQSLKASGFRCDITLVSDRSAFESAVADSAFDLVLCDFNLPDYDGLSALRFAREAQPNTPVIMISGTLSEEEAVECMQAGASDYVLKQGLQRLARAVQKALDEAAQQEQRRLAEIKRRRGEQKFADLFELSPDAIVMRDEAGVMQLVNRRAEQIFGYQRDELIGEDVSTLISAGAQPILAAARQRFLGSVEDTMHIDDRALEGLRRDGTVFPLEASLSRVRTEAGAMVVATLRDISERRRAEERMRLQELALEAATNAILIVDSRAPDYPIVHVNRAFETMTGYTAAEAIGINCRFLQGSDRDQPELERVRSAIRSGESASVLVRNYRKDGTLFWNQLQISPVRSEAGTVTHFLGIQNDVTELKTYQTELEYRANYDALTGLANKNLFSDRLDQALGFAVRSGEQVALLYLDLDRFKNVNDSLGHSSGDALLKHVAQRIHECTRETDTVARLGGDEFAVVLATVDHASSAAAIAQEILQAVERPVTILEHEVFSSASIGICIYPTDGANAETLLKNADTAMYRAKASGRNQLCFYTEDLNANALERLRLEADLRRALAMEEFELHYQPRVELATGRITSVEALIRWRRGEQGLISPARFIPLAEETGLIVPIGAWVLRTACTQMRLWRDAGYDTLRVAVNLSTRQFRQPDLLEMILTTLRETGLDARHLELEITESMAMHDPKHTQGLLEKLSGLGIALAIDDFGTGYSSLAYLKRFPIDYLKIDQSFVRGIPADKEDELIVRSIIALGQSLELVLIAEGVETEEQRAFLRAEGCEEMQGYLFSRPKPATEIDVVLAQSRAAGPGS
jgi:diguanylate cyclase (GGDEF)-like protein/PAS domain S-box-containing protein